MAAMRLGCLFSQAANVAYLHKAQSPYSVNTLAVLAARAAVRDTRVRRTTMWPKCWPRANCCAWASERLGIPYFPVRQFRAVPASASAPSKCATSCATQGILVRDRSYEIARLRARHRRHARADARGCLTALEEIW